MPRRPAAVVAVEKAFRDHDILPRNGEAENANHKDALGDLQGLLDDASRGIERSEAMDKDHDLVLRNAEVENTSQKEASEASGAKDKRPNVETALPKKAFDNHDLVLRNAEAENANLKDALGDLQDLQDASGRLASWADVWPSDQPLPWAAGCGPFAAAARAPVQRARRAATPARKPTGKGRAAGERRQASTLSADAAVFVPSAPLNAVAIERRKAVGAAVGRISDPAPP